MATDYHRFLFVFVDGIGLVPAAPSNPLSETPSAELFALLGGPLTIEQTQSAEGVLLKPIDATLGVDGLPQSATGQTALLTGVNAPLRLGRHITGFPGPRLRKIVEESSILLHASRRGHSSTFANAYTEQYLRRLEDGSVRRSVTTCAVQAAAVPFRTLADLERGRAVTWDIEGDLAADRAGVPIERVDSVVAGRRLAKLANSHRLTLFETFLPDTVGHGRTALPAAEVVRRLDGLLGGILGARRADTTVILTSDHGNFEDNRTRTHSRAPVPLLVVGPAARHFSEVESILEVTPELLGLLGPRV
ncbi:MAG: metalloenzyme [Acidobacteriota bacterium]|nr:metalloenzyme [Acidobacteriota bacterium]